MGYVDDFLSIDLGEQIYRLREGVYNDGKHMKVNLDALVALKVANPTAATEIDGYITAIKTAITNTLANY